MRTAITTAAVVALIATGAGSAAARQIETPAGPSAAGIHADGLRWQAKADWYLHHKDLVTSPNAQDVARGDYPGMQSGSVAHPRMQAARTVEIAGSGFDWADAAIGAGLATALLLSAAGASAMRRQHPAAR
jgi:hypothetical protein